MDTTHSARQKNVPLRRLREERERHNWTYKDVADQIDLPDSRTVGRWERGVSFPSAHYRQQLCRIFEKSSEELELIRHSPDKDESIDEIESTNVLHLLPVFFSSFIGRKQDVATASSMLMRQDVRLLTLLGTGGIGKTRLAVEVAAQVREYFHDGVCFISLAALSDPALVISSIADALGVHGTMTLSLVQQVKTFLRGKHLLLLLDNFEHVVNASPVLEEILRTCQHVKILVTSRELLHLQSECEFAVAPLSLPDLNRLPEAENLMQYTAIALFVLRAQTFLPSFMITRDTAHTIAELCIRLDGLPLAIELAAARIKLLSPESLLSRLEQDMHILKSDLRTVPERQRTLYHTIEWSYDLLDPQEKWFFWHFSVFAGGATFETIEAFFQSDPQRPADLMGIVSSLLGKSLLQCLNQESADPRFTMLETIRHFGLDCLQAHGKLEDSKRIYAYYYLRVVENADLYLKGSQQSLWLKKLGREQTNLRAALDILIAQQETALALQFCEDYGKFCGLSGYWSEEQRLLKTVLSLPHTSQEQAIRAKVLRRAGHLAYRLRDFANARALLEESVACSREIDDKQNLARALCSLGMVFYRQSEIVRADHLLREGVEIAYQSGDNWALANTLESQGRFLHREGKTNEAHALLEESVALSRKLQDKESLARIITTQVDLEIALGNIEQAKELAQESYKLAIELGTRPLIALTLDTLGGVAMFQGMYEQARQYLEERIAMAHEFGDAPTVASRQLKLADIALALGRPGQATRLVEEALLVIREQEDIPGTIEAFSVLGDLKRFGGDLARAKFLYKEALRLHKEPEDEKKFGRCLVGLAQIFLDEGQVEYAVSLCRAVESRLHPKSDMHPARYAEYQQIKESMRSQLDEERFGQIWGQGSNISLDLILRTIM